MELHLSKPPESFNNDIFREQVHQLYRGTWLAVTTTLIISSLLMLALWQHMPHNQLIWWWLSLQLSAMVRVFLAIGFLRTRHNDVSLRSWYHSYLVSVVISALIWAVSIFWLAPENRWESQAVIVYSIVGISAGAFTTLSYLRTPFIIFVSILCLTLGFRFLTFSSQSGYILAAASIFLILGLSVGARFFYNTNRQNISYRYAGEIQRNALQSSEKRYRTLIDTAVDAFFLHDETGRFVDVNQQACRSLGYSRDELLGLSVHDIDPSAQSLSLGNKWTSLHEGEVLTIQSVHKRKDGNLFPVEVRLGVIQGDHEKLFSVLVRDITERTLAEEKLRLSEEQAKAQYRSIPVPTYTWQRKDADFVLIDYNEAAEIFTHGAVNYFIGMSLNDMYKDEPEIRDDIARCLEEKQFIEKEMPYFFSKANRHAYLAVKYAFVPPDRVMVHTEDISERFRAEQAVLESREKLAMAQRIAKLGNWEWDLKTGAIDWSDEIFRIFEYEKQKVASTAENFMSAIHPDDIKLVSASEERAHKGERYFDEEWRIYTKTGSLKYIHLRGERFFNQEGEPIRMVGTLQDITERKQAEITKNEFVSTVSHEIRTPLTSILGSLSLLKNKVVGEQASPQAEEMIRVAYDNSQRLLTLINDILDLSKIEAGKMRLRLQPVALGAFLHEAVRANQGYCELKQVSLITEGIPNDDVTVMADTDRLMQVMNNLISNAIKFSPVGSRVRIGLHNDDRQVCIRIEDEGPGISPEFLPRLFDKFSQSNASNTRLSGGTGLGLYISKFIVEQHDGGIAYEPTDKGGACFIVCLPRG